MYNTIGSVATIYAETHVRTHLNRKYGLLLSEYGRCLDDRTYMMGKTCSEIDFFF